MRRPFSTTEGPQSKRGGPWRTRSRSSSLKPIRRAEIPSARPSRRSSGLRPPLRFPCPRSFFHGRSAPAGAPRLQVGQDQLPVDHFDVPFGSTLPSTSVMFSSSEQRTTWMNASASRMWEDCSPVPPLGWRPSPARDVDNWKVVRTTPLGLNMSARQTLQPLRREASTAPASGSIVRRDTLDEFGSCTHNRIEPGSICRHWANRQIPRS